MTRTRPVRVRDQNGGISMAAVEVQGTFDSQRFFNTLAMLISEREKVSVTVTVTKAEEEPGKQRQEKIAV